MMPELSTVFLPADLVSSMLESRLLSSATSEEKKMQTRPHQSITGYIFIFLVV